MKAAASRILARRASQWLLHRPGAIGQLLPLRRHLAITTANAGSPRTRSPLPPKPSGHPPSAWRRAVDAFHKRLAAPDTAAQCDSTDVHSAIAACVAAQRHEEAARVLQQARAHEIPILATTVATAGALFARAGDIDTALTMLREMVAEQPVTGHTTMLYDPILQVFRDSDDWQSMQRVLRDLTALQIQPSRRMYRVMLRTAARSKQRALVLQLVQDLQAQWRGGMKMDVRECGAMCQALLDVDEAPSVLALYRAIDAAWLDRAGSTPLFNHFFAAALRSGDAALATAIFDRMKHSTAFQPDDYTYSTYLMDLAGQQQWTTILHVFEEMQARDQVASGQARSCINALSCTAVTRALHKQHSGTQAPVPSHPSPDLAQRVDELVQQYVLHSRDHDQGKAPAQVRVMADVRYDHASTLIDALVALKHVHLAMQIFRMMVERGLLEPHWLRRGGTTIDLHLMSVGTATCAVVHAFQQLRAWLDHHHHQPSADAPVPLQDMHIIVGRGKHSKTPLQPALAQPVLHVLERSFHPAIRATYDRENTGKLVVSSQAIRRWLDAAWPILHFE